MDKQDTFIRASWLQMFVLFAVLLNFSGLFITIIAPDGALYASIAKSMVLRGNYTDLVAEGHDWLDKPHFPFWMAALSFNCFGFTTWAYKLPALLFLMLGAWYTYRFALKLYTKEIALWAVLILLTAEHIVISNNDVRAEPYLTGLIIASVYHFYVACNDKKNMHIIWACLFAACAVMTKGIFALIPICGAFAGQFIIKRQWSELFNLRWLVAALLILLFIAPELFSLYRQFDLHPEKVVFGHTGVSGIKFFFWDSQFGRFFNTGPIKGQGDPTFFIHTTLWAFLPWSLLLFAAIFQFIKTKRKDVQNAEWFCISAALLTFLVFSASKFQLPFYTNIIYPFFAIITAQYLCGLKKPVSIKAAAIVQRVVVVLMILVICLLAYFYRPEGFTFIKGIVLLAAGLAILILPQRLSQVSYQKTAMVSFLAALFVNLYFNLLFYPSLLKYQAGSEAAFYINTHNPQRLPVAQYIGDYAYPLEFYLNQPLHTIYDNGTGTPPAKPFFVYGDVNMLNDLAAQKHLRIEPVKVFDRFWITKLTPAFLNYRTRASATDKYGLYLVR